MKTLKQNFNTNSSNISQPAKPEIFYELNLNFIIISLFLFILGFSAYLLNYFFFTIPLMEMIHLDDLKFIEADGFSFYLNNVIRDASAPTQNPILLDISLLQDNSGIFTAKSLIDNNEHYSLILDILEGSFNLSICIFVILNLTIFFLI